MKVKMFQDKNLTSLDGAVNYWLKGNKNIRIKDIKQTQSQNSYDSYITISIWYKDRTPIK